MPGPAAKELPLRSSRPIRLVIAAFSFAGALACQATLAAPARAAAGALDASFGNHGVVVTGFGGPTGAAAVAVQPDGKIVAAGAVELPSGGAFALARYLTNGAPDPAFGTAGKVTTGFGSSRDAHATAMAIEPNGKIVVAGFLITNGPDEVALARYLTNGAPDPTFGRAGLVAIPFGFDARAAAVAVRGDGAIVIAGEALFARPHFLIARYLPDGEVDPAFGSGGHAVTWFTGDSSATAVALQGNGEIVAAGSTVFRGKQVFALARYETSGALDLSFSENGKARASFRGDSGAQGLALQGDGRIVAAGFATDPTTFVTMFALVRYLPDGTLDPGFSGNGKHKAAFGDSAVATAVALAPDGRIVAAGNVAVAGFALARFEPNGRPDVGFGTQGEVVTVFSGFDEAAASAIAVQPNGRIVAAGSAFSSRTLASRFALVRYLAS